MAHIEGDLNDLAQMWKLSSRILIIITEKSDKHIDDSG